MQIKFSPSAENDLDEIFRYLKIENPPLARQTIKNIGNHIKTLTEFPQKGRLGLTDATRELIIPSLPYSVPYEVYDETIYILRIYHNSRKPIETNEVGLGTQIAKRFTEIGLEVDIDEHKGQTLKKPFEDRK